MSNKLKSKRNRKNRNANIVITTKDSLKNQDMSNVDFLYFEMYGSLFVHNLITGEVEKLC